MSFCLEGHKNNPYPKIEVLRKDVEPLYRDGKEDQWIAVVGDEKQDVGIPHFQVDEIQRLADLLEERYLKR